MEHFEAFLATMEDPISHEIMDDPVVTPYGHSFSAKSITRWLETSQTCPITSKPLNVNDLKPNYTLRSLILRYKEAKQNTDQRRSQGMQQASSESVNSSNRQFQRVITNNTVSNPAKALSETRERMLASQNHLERLRSLKEDSDVKVAQIERERNDVTLEILRIDKQIKDMEELLQKLNEAKSKNVERLLELKTKEKEAQDELTVVLNEIMDRERSLTRLAAQLSQLSLQPAVNPAPAPAPSDKKIPNFEHNNESEKEVSPRAVTPPMGRSSASPPQSHPAWGSPHYRSSASGSNQAEFWNSSSSSSFWNSPASNSRPSMQCSAKSDDSLVYSFLGEFPRVWINTIHTDNRAVYAGCSDSSIKVFTMTGNNKKARLDDEVNAGQSYVMALLSDDRGHVWSGGADGSIKIWEFVQHKLRCISHVKNAHTGWVTQMAFVNRNTVMPSVSFDDESEYPEQSNDNTGVLKMDRNMVLITAANDGFVKVWNPRNFKCKHIYQHASDKILCMSFNQNFLLTGSQNGIVTIWDANSQKLVGKTTVHDAAVSDMMIDKRTSLLWTCSYDCKVKVWDTRAGILTQPQITLSSHSAPVKALVFDSSTFKAFTGSKDGKLFLWDARSPSEPLLCVQHGQHGRKSSVLSLGLSSENAALFSGGEDGRIVQWFCNLV